MRYRKNSASKYQKSPHSRGPVPRWVVEAVDGGAQVYESGEHGFWTVTRGCRWVTDADTSRGKLAHGDDWPDAENDLGEIPTRKAVAWLLGEKRNPKRSRNPFNEPRSKLERFGARSFDIAYSMAVSLSREDPPARSALKSVERAFLEAPQGASRSEVLRIAHNDYEAKQQYRAEVQRHRELRGRR